MPMAPKPADNCSSTPRWRAARSIPRSRNSPTVAWWRPGPTLRQSPDDPSGYAIRSQIFNSDGSTSGDEFLVNTTTTDDQFDPSVAALSGGGFVVAWVTAAGDDIHAQIFDANGSKAGAEFLVNTATTNNQTRASIAALAGGGFVVSWTDTSGSPDELSAHAVRAQVYAANGATVGSEFLVNTTTVGGQLYPDVAALPDGRFVIAWMDSSHVGDDSSGSAIRAQVFNGDGSKSGAELLVNTTAAADQIVPSISVLADGRFVVAWDDNSQSPDDPSGHAIRGQIFDPRESGVTVYGTAGGDDYIGSSFADGLVGGGGNDHLVGGGGNDQVDGGVGSDMALGGTGDDMFFIDNAGDVVIELPNEGSDTVFAPFSHTLAANVENLVLGAFSGAINGTGNELDNTIIGNFSNNVLDGGDGNDQLRGAGGIDTLLGGGGDDTLAGGAGANSLNGGAGSDAAGYGDAAAAVAVDLGNMSNNQGDAAGDSYVSIERIVGSGFADTLTGDGSANWLDGGGGANLLHGLGGNDYVTAAGDLNVAFGDDGNDQLYFNGHQNQLYGADGNDWIGVNGTNNALVGAAGDDWLGASGMSNTVVVGEGNDTAFAYGTGNYLYGENGNDWVGVSGSSNHLLGGTGHDWIGATGNGNVLDGGAGNDTLVGAVGHTDDVFVYGASYGLDEVQGFAAHSVGGSDVVDLRAFGLASYAQLQQYMSQAGADVAITLSGEDVLTLRNVSLDWLQAGDFMLA